MKSIKEVEENFPLWLHDGGGPAYRTFIELLPEGQKIIRFLGDFWEYRELRIGENNFFMAHAVPEKERILQSDDIEPDDLFFGKSLLEEFYVK